MAGAARVRAREDPSLDARVVARRALRYAAGAGAASDRPAHVRAASAACWLGGRLAIVQDDASFIALVSPIDGAVDALELPAGAGGARQFDDARGNKEHKLDLEAAVAIERGDRAFLLVFGSGSTRARERIVSIDRTVGARVCEAPSFYDALRRCVDFAGSELNVEGVVARGDRLVLFQRGNGARRGELEPVDATCEISLGALLAHLEDPSGHDAPEPEAVTSYDLGTADGIRLTFTDATLARDRTLYAAVAEESPDVTRDGVVRGAAIGILDAGAPPVARWARLRNAGGRILADKIEGLAPDPSSATHLYGVVDRDDPGAAAELVRIELAGPWWP